MTRKDYIPSTDIGFDQWLQEFTNYVVTYFGVLGITVAEKDALVARRFDWNNKYQNHIDAVQAVRGTKEMKDNCHESTEEYARFIAQRIQSYSETTDAQREALGITVKDEELTGLSEDVVLMTPPPTLSVDHSQPGISGISFGLNPQNERENAKPDGIAGAKIWFYIGGLPPEGASWQFLADDTNSPYIHKVNNAATVTIAYRAQWFDRKMRLGPLGDPVVVAVTA
ncbi:MAG: hypothetical protein HY769_03965 [Candidatus Stahlbacteria bacterium]|nr:hypothetical protein [Candidatus Stahlbacteria bacterium]